MKKLIGLFFLLFSSINLIAQDTRVVSGIIEYEQMHFENALAKFNAALNNPDQLKEKNLVKGHYYRAKTILALIRSTEQTEPEYFSCLDKSIMAYDDIKKTFSLDETYRAKAENIYKSLQTTLLNAGLIYLNASMTDDISESDSKAYLEKAKLFLEPLTQEPQHYSNKYLACDLLAQVYQGLQDSLNAYEYFNLSADNYISNTPETPDLLISYVYYRKAFIERYNQKNIEKAYASINEGVEMLEKEYLRVEMMKNRLGDKTYKQYQQQYERARNDLKRFRLDILLNVPKLYEQALNEFETAVKENPRDYIILTAYAQLLESSDMAKAVIVYEKAIQLDPTKELAYYNLGAIYNNRAKVYHEQLLDISNDSQYMEIQHKMTAEFEKAYEMFSRAFEINPNSLSTVQALKQITIFLDKMDEYNTYKEAEKILRGY